MSSILGLTYLISSQTSGAPSWGPLLYRTWLVFADHSLRPACTDANPVAPQNARTDLVADSSWLVVLRLPFLCSARTQWTCNAKPYMSCAATFGNNSPLTSERILIGDSPMQNTRERSFIIPRGRIQLRCNV